MQGLLSGFACDSGGLLQNGQTSFAKFVVLHVDVDHQVAVDVAEASHGAAREHVQDHLLGGAGFHAAGSGDDFGTDVGDDGEVRGFFQRGCRVAGDGDGLGAVTAGVFDGGDGERCASAGGDSDYDVVLAGFLFRHFALAELAGVLAGFGGAVQRFDSAGDYELHGLWIGVKGRRTLGGVECAEAAAGSGADVDQAASFVQGGCDEIDCAGDLR